MRIHDETFFKAIRGFLTIYLPKQRCYSPNTVNSYKITLNLFVDFMIDQKQVPLHKVSFDHLKMKTVLEFLDWLQSERNCSSSTRNQRLMALRSFAKYAGMIDVAQMSLFAELVKVPVQKTNKGIVSHLSEDALKALLAQPGSKRRTDVRNRFLMVLMYDTAARCQEILDLRLKDFELNTKSPFVYLTGKGNKTRTVPVMAKTVEHYRAYIELFHPKETRSNDSLLFYTVRRGEAGKMSPDNVAHFIKSYGEMARGICSSVPAKVNPHQLRHTRAIHLYRGGMPIVLLSEFLGHANISTTQIYAYADTEMKRKALEKIDTLRNGDESSSEVPIWENNDEIIRKLYGLA